MSFLRDLTEDIFELVKDKVAAKLLADQIISEMAKSRAEAYKIVNGISYHVAFHLLKVFVFPNHPAIRHWQKELQSFRFQIIKANHTKKTNGNFDFDYIWKNVWEDYLSKDVDIDGFLNFLSQEGFFGVPKREEIDLKSFEKFVRSFCESMFGEPALDKYPF